MRHDCSICKSDLANAKKSAEKKDGSYYLLCNNCGNVSYVKKNKVGLTTVEATPEDNSSATMIQIKEALELFKEAGYTPGTYSLCRNDSKKSISELNKKEEHKVKDTSVKEEKVEHITEETEIHDIEDFKEITEEPIMEKQATVIESVITFIKKLFS